MAGDVGWHHVRGELDARVAQGQGLRQCAHQERLAQAWNALEEHVAGGRQRHYDLLDHCGLPDHRLAYFMPQACQALRGVRDWSYVRGHVATLPYYFRGRCFSLSRAPGAPFRAR